MTTFIARHRDVLHRKLAAVDRAARDHVRSGKGGPFAAQITLFLMEDDGCLAVLADFPIATNSVIETGVASNHAEAQTLAPETIATIKACLRDPDMQRGGTPYVVLFSSAQPCLACLTKIKIFARSLVQENLIEPRHFVLLYGATYEDTEQTAGFNDYAYALDLFHLVHKNEAQKQLIRRSVAPLAHAPEPVQTALRDNPFTTALLYLDDRIIGFGQDQRTERDLFQTAECVAIHAASRLLKQEGNATPWNLQGAQLFTLNPDIGPLTYTECQWAAVEQIITLSGTTRDEFLTINKETPALSNHDFCAFVVRGFNTPQAMIHVIHDGGFANLAQHEWANRPGRVYYNGVAPSSALTMPDKAAFDGIFRPDPLDEGTV